ncbi:MAG: hypothetical protein NC200_04985 [Candidatus Gastranaerophilales bacterium]|nr:hypothetical protein [Candidatus Gastranaerophilales bacterium]
MSMTVSVVNTNGIPYEQHGTDRQKAKAEKFINMSNAETTKMAVKNYNKRYREDDKKFVKKVDIATKSIPLIAAASSLALKQGGKAALRNGAMWGIGLMAPAVISTLNKAATKASPKLNEFERKHSTLTYFAGLTASVGTFFGMNALVNKAVKSPKMLAHPKAQEFINNVKDGAESILATAKEKIKMPEKLKGVTEKFKLPEKLATRLETFKNAETTKAFTQSAKSFGKKVLRNAPILTVLAIGGALVGKVFQESSKIAGIKSNIKNAQFETAKNLVNAYSAENESLKEANSIAGERLASSSIAEDEE